MTEQKAVKDNVRMVAIINQGGGMMQVSTGKVLPGQSIEVPAAEADKLVKYKHIKYAKDVVKGLGQIEDLRKENQALRDQIKDMEIKLQDFLNVDSKKGLDVLQAKYDSKNAKADADEPEKEPETAKADK